MASRRRRRPTQPNGHTRKKEPGMNAPPQPLTTTVNGLVASGLAQIGVGALVGFPYAAASYKPELLERFGIQAPGRIRQLHLDLIMMGGLVTATGVALPHL